MTDTFDHELQIEQIIAFDYATMHYGTTIGGDVYFSRRLRRAAWVQASEADKLAALYEATEMLERLNYKGDKTDSTQRLEFPRGGDTEVPTNIEKAAYEVAYNLLAGLDPELEAKASMVKRTKTGPLETEFVGQSIPAYVIAGIFGATAWGLIYPYLRDPSTVNFKRVD